MAKKETLSPMMQHYLTLKEEYKDAIVMFRLGDFYEMFFDDAVKASNILGLTLTGRACGLEERAPMCGVPFHAVNTYLNKLIKAGEKVAICEQLNTPEEANGGLVDRGVVRVITPGTIIEDNILDDKKNNYLASVFISGNKFAISWIDISTGEFNVVSQKFDNSSIIEDLLLTIYPAEIITDENSFKTLNAFQSVNINKLPKIQKYLDWTFACNTAYETLLKQFNTQSLIQFEIDQDKVAISAAGALISYVIDTQKRELCHISSIKLIKNSDYMVLDSNTIRNLELLESSKDASKKASLLGVLDKTCTNMGARNIRKWIEKPLGPLRHYPAWEDTWNGLPYNISKEINLRLDAVEELINSTAIRKNLIETLSQIKDIERLCTKVSYGNPSPRDYLAIADSLSCIPKVKSLLSLLNSQLLVDLNNNIDELNDLYQLLFNSIDEDASAIIRDGGFIKKGYNQELDKLKNAKNEGNKWLAELEAREKEETGIKTLKVGYNKVFGYYIEVSKGAIDLVPLRYIRKQTLTTGERFITDELKQIEDTLLNSTDLAIKIELELFDKITKTVLSYIPRLQSLAKSIADLDTIISFAQVSLNNNYSKPKINEYIDKIEIIDGRHPVVESLLKNTNYVANDTLLDNCINRTMIITGPNMGGKSTYMRQVALITIMAHIGCFVPARSAEISITDRVFTRIGASDDLAYGQSTFMVEMLEVSTILLNATYKSLLVLDEIGRGTSTYDGMAIARAVIEDVTQRIRCKTLFSTHYHELTELENSIEGVKNYKVVAAEKNEKIIFLHKIMHGGTDKSFGIEIAKLAGFPKDVIKRSREIQKLLKNINLTTQKQTEDLEIVEIAKDNRLKDIIKHIDLDNMSPMQAFVQLQELIDISKED